MCGNFPTTTIRRAPQGLCPRSDSSGLGAFVLMTVAYPVLYLLGRLDLLTGSVFQLRFPGDTAVQLAGTALLAVGLVLAFWSLSRDRARSAHDDRAVRLCATRCTRATCFAFAGLFPLTLNLLALLSLLAVPAQIAVARREEAALEARYGTAYRAYAARTGRFWPRLRRRERMGHL